MKQVLAVGILAGLSIAAAPPLPKATTIGRSGFATIRLAAPSPTRDVVSQRPTHNGPIEFYAHEEGLTIAEAGKRLSEQSTFQPIFERLQERLRRMEPDNYISARIAHKPDWHYILFFKRDPAATLARYSVNPRFRSARAAYTRTELDAIAAPWTKRFSDVGILDVYGASPLSSRVEMSLSVSAAEYAALATAKGWGAVPSPIVLSFARDLAVPRVNPRVARLLRVFASESRATVMQAEAGFSGRVVLDDGCLRLAGNDKRKGPLVVFHQETGIGLDAQGYLAAIDRRTGKASGRIGEWWSWAGPNPGSEFDGLDALKAACGGGPVTNVGNPESDERFKARYAR